MLSRLNRCWFVTVLILYVTSCTSWQATQLPLRDLEGNRLRLTTRDSTKVTGKLVHADSLGMVVLDEPFPQRFRVIGDTSRVVGIETRAFSAAQTAEALVWVTGFAVILIVAFASGWGWWDLDWK